MSDNEDTDQSLQYTNNQPYLLTFGKALGTRRCHCAPHRVQLRHEQAPIQVERRAVFIPRRYSPFNPHIIPHYHPVRKNTNGQSPAIPRIKLLDPIDPLHNNFQCQLQPLVRLDQLEIPKNAQSYPSHTASPHHSAPSCSLKLPFATTRGSSDVAEQLVPYSVIKSVVFL